MAESISPRTRLRHTIRTLSCCPCVVLGVTKNQAAGQSTERSEDPPICTNCSGIAVVYKDREGMFANLDGHGNYDIWTCNACTGHSTWVECSHDPAKKYPGIVMRGSRARSWFESSAGNRTEPVQDTATVQHNQTFLGDKKTLFGLLAAKCIHIGVYREESLIDFHMQSFTDAVQIYCDAFKLFGSAASLVVADTSKNLQGVIICCQDRPGRCDTLRAYLQAELDTGLHTAAPESLCKLTDPSGAMQLQWLLRGLEFVIRYLELLFQGEENAAKLAYMETLSRYHGTMTSFGFKAALLGMPSKEGVCQVHALCPDVEDQTEREIIIAEDVRRVTSVFLPLVKQMISTCREFQLWDSATV